MDDHTHNWSNWITAKKDGKDGYGEPTDLEVRICSSCGRVQARKKE